ncbi:MAG: trypsin-like peptidase domain-containing protein [Nitrososphaeraceae archaeon]
MEHNIKKVTVLLLSIVGAAAIIVSSTTALPSSPLHSIMAQQQQQQNVVQSSSSSINPLTSPSSSSPSSSSASSSSLANVFKRVENSVVQITSTRSDPNQVTIINGVPATGRSTALGSGFVYDNQGHIITNHHVIDGATTADVTFTDGNTYSAKVIGKDPDADIAVLQITDNFSEEKVMPLPVANSSSLRPGDQLIAIGNPFGLSGTITTGIVSGEGRLLPNPDTGFSIPNIIQTDAPINPGNSGGPLLNIQGQVIGMNTAILSRTGSYSGVGFAIPSNAIAKEVPVLIKGGTYAHPWLGISGGKITPDIAQSAGLPANYKGVVVGSVQPGSPADKAGTQALTQDMAGSNTHIGDIITAIDGHPTRQIDDIINYVDSNKNVGDNVKLTINRNGQTTDVTATLQARPDTISQQQQQQQQQQQPQQPQQPGLGPIPGFPQLPPDLAPLLP